MKLIVHIGAHKTATTHLQMRLRRGRAALAATNAAYVGPDDTRGPVQLSSLVEAPGAAPDEEAGWRARIDAEAEAGRGRLLLSEENLIGVMRPGLLIDRDGRLYPRAGPQLRALFQVLDRRPTSIALAVREPASFLTSAFGMWLQAGGGVLVEDFLRGADPRRSRWTDLAARIFEATGTPRLSVWRYEDYPRARNRILARLLGPDRVAAVPGARRALVGWSQAAYDRLVQDVLGAGPQDSLADLARAARAAHPRRHGMPRLEVIPEAVRAECAAHYEADWQALIAMPGVRPVT